MEPDLSNIKKRIKGKRDLIDRISAKLPGFSSMVEAAEKYAADQFVRDHMAEEIQKIKKEISKLSAALSKEGVIDYLSDLESLNMNFERLYKKTKYADYGTSASTTSLKISDSDKERLLEYDWRLIASIEEFNEIIDRLKTSRGEELKKVIIEVQNKIDDFEASFDSRKNVLLEVI